MKKIIKIIFLLCFSFPGLYVYPQETENAEIKKQEEKKIETARRRIKWDDAEGAIEYKVLISNSQGKIIIYETVTNSSFDVELPSGEYRIRIGAVNKFGKVGSWSDWANISFEGAEEEEETREQRVDVKPFESLPPMFLRIGIGPSYFQLLSGWSDLYHNSCNSTTVQAGAAPLGYSYLRYAGIELEGVFTRFESKSEEWRIETEMTNVIAGLNIFAKSRFNFSVNIIFRLGGGAVYTRQEYERYNSNNIHSRSIATLESTDMYYRAGFSAEYRINKYLFLEAGADFYLVKYLTSDLKGLKYSVMIGTGL